MFFYSRIFSVEEQINQKEAQTHEHKSLTLNVVVYGECFMRTVNCAHSLLPLLLKNGNSKHL